MKIIPLIVKNKWFILAIIVLTLSFYWFEWRPYQLEQECKNFVVSIVRKTDGKSWTEADRLYNLCIDMGGGENLNID